MNTPSREQPRKCRAAGEKKKKKNLEVFRIAWKDTNSTKRKVLKTGRFAYFSTLLEGKKKH